MEKEMLYTIGETLLVEIDEIEYITYPQEDTIKIQMKDDKVYILSLAIAD
ncbi:MAG: hypothetical protein WC292_03785 [Clostridia bacterium]